MGYSLYYLVWIALSYGLRSPWLLGGILLVLAAQRWLPDPAVYFRTLARVRGLESEREANPANVTVRRDLARIYLDRKRPKKALTYLEEARRRAKDDAELEYLTGVCLHRRGQHEQALGPLVRAIEIDSRVAFGEPYFVAGQALLALGKLDEAEDALLRYLEVSSSSLDARLALARLARKAGRPAEAARWLDEAVRVYGELPGYARRKQFGARLRVQLARITVQRQASQIVIAAVVLAVAGLGAVKVVGYVRNLPKTPATQVKGLPHVPTGADYDDEDVDPSIAAAWERWMPKPERFRRVPPKTVETLKFEWPRPATPTRGLDGDLMITRSICALIPLYGPPDVDATGDPMMVLFDTDTGLHVGARVTDGAAVWGVEETPSLERRMKAQQGLMMVGFAVDPNGGMPTMRDCEVTFQRAGGKRRVGVRNGEAFSEPVEGK